MFTMLNQSHANNTRAATNNILHIPHVRTEYSGEPSLKLKASQTWNDLQINFNSYILTYCYSELRKAVFQKYLASCRNTT